MEQKKIVEYLKELFVKSTEAVDKEIEILGYLILVYILIEEAFPNIVNELLQFYGIYLTTMTKFVLAVIFFVLILCHRKLLATKSK